MKVEQHFPEKFKTSGRYHTHFLSYITFVIRKPGLSTGEILFYLRSPHTAFIGRREYIMRNWETILSVILINHTSPWYPHGSRDGIRIVIAMVSIENENDTKRNETKLHVIVCVGKSIVVVRHRLVSSLSLSLFSLFTFLNSLTPSLHSYSLVLTLPPPLHSLLLSRCLCLGHLRACVQCVARHSSTCLHVGFHILLCSGFFLSLFFSLFFFLLKTANMYHETTVNRDSDKIRNYERMKIW